MPDKKGQHDKIKPLLIKCSKCNKKMEPRYLKKHHWEAHDVVLEVTNTTKAVQSINTPAKITIKRNVGPRGTRVDVIGQCDKCGEYHGPLYQFKEDSENSVLVCERCKKSIKRELPLASDALNIAHSGGRFEGNKRKH